MPKGEPLKEWFNRLQLEQAELRSVILASFSDGTARAISGVPKQQAERVAEAVKYAGIKLGIKMHTKYDPKAEMLYFIPKVYR